LWFPPVDIPLGDGRVGSPPVLVIVASFSRLISGVKLPSRTTPDLLAGMWSLLSGQLEAVPHRLIDDEVNGRQQRQSETRRLRQHIGLVQGGEPEQPQGVRVDPVILLEQAINEDEFNDAVRQEKEDDE